MLHINLRSIIIIIFYVLQVGTKSHAQEIPLLTNDSLDKYVEQALSTWQIPGIAISIVKDGKVLVEKGYGVIDRQTNRPINNQTAFPLASISKTFTGTLFATMEAEGHLSLNDLVKKWLPTFHMDDKLYEQQITLADVLSHRSGWKTFQGDLLNTESSLTYGKMIQLFGKQTPAYPLRTKFGYSNFGFIIAGECVNSIRQKTWNEYLNSRLLLPLGMTRTLVFANEIRNDNNLVKGHTVINDSLKILPPDKIEPFSHGGMYASIENLSIWMQVLLNKGTLGTKSIIPENAISKMWQSHTIIGESRAADRELYFKTYGIGWEIMHYRNTKVIHHNGAYSGALTSLALVPGLNLGISILTNQDSHMLHETLKWQIIDAFMQRMSPNYTLAAIERQSKRRAENMLIFNGEKHKKENFATSMDAIAGTYFCENYGKAFIRQEGNEFKLSLEHHPELSGTFSLYQADKLTCSYNHPMFGIVQIPFIIENDRAKSFTLFVDGFVEDNGYEFKRL
jgi:CubicO group peptidase (beta-lactamase class C family)